MVRSWLLPGGGPGGKGGMVSGGGAGLGLSLSGGGRGGKLLNLLLFCLLKLFLI